MSDLFLVRRPTDAVLLLRPLGNGTWDFCRRPPVERKKAKNTLRFGADGWALVDDTSGQPGAILYRPVDGATTQDADRPPLGPWRRMPPSKGESGEECTLTDAEPAYTKIGDPNMLQAPFADISVADTGDIVRIEAALKRTPVTDDSFDILLKRFKELILGLVRRPRVILMLHLSMQDAAVPSMRHVKQFMNFVGENSWVIGMLVRGVAIVLKPQGYSGYALLNIVKMVLRLLPAPWQTGILPTNEEGRAFLDGLVPGEAQVLARKVAPCNFGDAPQSPAAVKGTAFEEATPSTMEEEMSPLGEISGVIGDTPSLERSSPQPFNTPKMLQQRVEDEFIEGEGEVCEGPDSPFPGCWGASWLFACGCPKP
jgi:hypothetical protein